MIIKHKIVMDLDRGDVEKRIDVMQDDKYSRDLVISLRSNRKEYCPPEGCAVLVRYAKPSGRVGAYDTMPDGTVAWSIAENVLTVRLAPQVCTEPGDVQVIVTLLKGAAELSCFAVTVHVQKGPGKVDRSEAYVNVKNFIPQPGSAVVGQYLKVLETDSQGRVTAVETAAAAESSGGEGKSAYQYAQEAGYTGTEAEFAAKLAEEVPKALYVNVVDNGDGTFVADKTVDEIKAAYESCAPVYAIIVQEGTPVIHNLFTCFEEDGYVAAVFVAQDTSTDGISAISIDSEGVIVESIPHNTPTMQNLMIRIGNQTVTYNGSEYKLLNVQSLKNPYALTINGQSYDGSEAVSVDTNTCYVTMSNNSVDKTNAEMYAAHQSGKALYLVMTDQEGMFIPCSYCDEYRAAFFGLYANTLFMIFIEGNVVEVSSVPLATQAEIPTVLRNPNALTINGVSYDGSEAVDVTIEAGGGDNIPDYVKTEAERLAAVVQSRQNENTVSAILSSDYHLPNSAHAYYAQILESITHAGQAMGILRSKLSLDFEAKLGDLLWDSGETPEEALANFQLVHSLASDGNILGRYEGNGNHDHLQSYDTPLTDAQVYANIGIYNRDCVRDSGNRAGGYCYRDYEEFKLRVILLNTSEANDGSFTLSSAQVAWLGDALAIPEEEGWGTLILSHHPLDWGGSSTAVMNKIKAASGIIANLHGHVHTFTQDVITGTEIPRLAIPNVCFYRNNEYGTNGTTENSEGIEFGTTATYSKTAGTATDTSFCILTIDREAGKLYLDHYGAGIDREADVPTWAKLGYTNLVPTSEAADSTDVYNGIGYKDGYYLSSNGAGEDSVDAACVATGFIPYIWTINNPIYVKGASVTSDSHCRIYGHTSKSHINQSCMATGSNMSTHFTVEELESGNYYKLTPTKDFSGTITYVRLSLIGTGENLIVTVNEPIAG